MTPDQGDTDGISTIAKELSTISRDNEENRERERAGSHHEEEGNSLNKSEKDRGDQGYTCRICNNEVLFTYMKKWRREVLVVFSRLTRSPKQDKGSTWSVHLG